MRSEQAVFDDLASLCASPGYIHALAYVCYRDNSISFDGEITAEDTSSMFSPSRLIRTETTTLIGLMMRAPIDFRLPPPQIVGEYIEQTDSLLEELHAVIGAPIVSSMLTEQPDPSLFSSGKTLREAIFYSAESAYAFQYRDLAPRRYRQDTAWLLRSRGIDLAVAQEMCSGIAELIDQQLAKTLHGLVEQPPEDWTVLPAFTFSCHDVASHIQRPVTSVRAILNAFAMPGNERNDTFTSLHEFNGAYAYPLIRQGADVFVQLQPYGISEAIYETPFYWMLDDEAYAPIALRNRGDFTEAFAADRLAHVFGADRVFQNVEIRKSKATTLGEIDVLVIFGNRAIVVQAKSKKLTLEARTGNDRQLRSDFKAAVQDAVDQALDCAQYLGDSSVTLRCADGRPVPLTNSPASVFPISLVADHYPALTFQARQFLQVNASDPVVPPLVIDVFALDAMTEMLKSPLRLLSYLDRRARFGDKLVGSHEHMFLSLHLKRNLWVPDDRDMLMLEDNLSADLDLAMAVRRDGMPGTRTPDGILTRFEGTRFGSIIEGIEDQPHAVAIDLGLMLLQLSEEAVRKIDSLIDEVVKRTADDGGLHDVTYGCSPLSCGLTVHCSRLEYIVAESRLMVHCKVRKYSQKADFWFGIALNPDGSLRFAGKLESEWRFDQDMEDLVVDWERSGADASSRRKVGRNQPCPCGSGKKYKRCCIRR